MMVFLFIFISFYLLYLFIIYYVFAEISRSGHSRHAVTASESHSEPQSYGKRHKKPSAKPGNRVPRVKVLNYLKKVALFIRFERDGLADGAQVIGRDAEKRCEVLQGKVMHDAGTTT